jgi:outer membrane protein OmpA-like peptidoglycan-associated protein
MQRAERIKQYLTDCGVSADRLTVVSRDLPEKASSVTLEDGLAENRRVELSSEMPDILSPVVSRQELERLSDPDLVEFIPEAKSSDAIASWSMELMQAGRVIRTINGNGDVRPMRWAIRPGELSDKQVPVDYSFTVENVRGVKKSVTGSLAVDYLSSMKKKQQRLADRTIDKFSLILFDFDKDEITPDNLRILESKVLPAIKFNSTVKIYGHTDRIGEDKYNRELSLRRAEATRKALQDKMSSVNYEAYGLGETKKIFDNDIPLGRHLSRTVQIVVETPR